MVPKKMAAHMEISAAFILVTSPAPYLSKVSLRLMGQFLISI
jgi:hypothetical protein